MSYTTTVPQILVGGCVVVAGVGVWVCARGEGGGGVPLHVHQPPHLKCISRTSGLSPNAGGPCLKGFIEKLATDKCQQDRETSGWFMRAI